MNVQQLLQQLVNIPSLSGQEGPAADFVAGLVEGWGIPVKRHGHNVWFELGSGSPRLLLASHLDTVPVCAGWDGDPWQAAWVDGHLTGLGANDAKGCVAALLATAHALKDAELGGTAIFALTAEEETGGVNGMGKVLSHFGPLDAALVGEPTSLHPCIAQRGMLLLDCTAKGESGHVAHAALAENAIHKASRDIARLSAMAFEPHDLLGVTKAQVTQVQGGLRTNQVPDACAFTVDLRTTPNLDHAQLAAQIAASLESEVKVRSARYVPKATAATSPIAQAARAASGKAFVGSATTSDWAFLGDLPAVKIGPGDTHRSHRPNEFILASELEAGAAYYTQAVQRYFARVGAVHV